MEQARVLVLVLLVLCALVIGLCVLLLFRWVFRESRRATEARGRKPAPQRHVSAWETAGTRYGQRRGGERAGSSGGGAIAPPSVGPFVAFSVEDLFRDDDDDDGGEDDPPPEDDDGAPPDSGHDDGNGPDDGGDDESDTRFWIEPGPRL